MTSDDCVLLEIDDRVATVTLNRPQARNALNMEVKTRLRDVLRAVAEDARVRAVVLRGAGGSFCSGGDIVEMDLNTDPTTSRARLTRLHQDVVFALAELEKPTIAQVEGHAHGAGLSLALACDLIITSDDAVLSCAFARVGLVPDCGAMYFLPRRISIGLAKELVFTGRSFSGADAVAWGIANRCVPADQVAEEVAGLAAELASSATVALGLAKRLLDAGSGLSLRELGQAEAFAQAVAYSTDDHLAARAAFVARQRPSFVGH